jgi:hypothetical protein
MIIFNEYMKGNKIMTVTEQLTALGLQLDRKPKKPE